MCKQKTDRRWRVVYDLAYDGGGVKWDGHYRTLIGAAVARWWNLYISSWGGTALVIDQSISLERRNDG